jgi:hypothetical protein
VWTWAKRWGLSPATHLALRTIATRPASDWLILSKRRKSCEPVRTNRARLGRDGQVGNQNEKLSKCLGLARCASPTLRLQKTVVFEIVGLARAEFSTTRHTAGSAPLRRGRLRSLPWSRTKPGAGGGNRTRTPIWTRDFKSLASTLPPLRRPLAHHTGGNTVTQRIKNESALPSAASPRYSGFTEESWAC